MTTKATNNKPYLFLVEKPDTARPAPGKPDSDRPDPKKTAASSRSTPRPEPLSEPSTPLSERNIELDSLSPKSSKKAESDRDPSRIKAKRLPPASPPVTEVFVKWGEKENERTFRIRILQKGKVAQGSKEEFEAIAERVKKLLVKIQDKEQGFVAENIKSAKFKLTKKKTEKNFSLKKWEDITFVTASESRRYVPIPGSTLTLEEPSLKEMEQSVHEFTQKALWVDEPKEATKKADPVQQPSAIPLFLKDHINVSKDGSCALHALIDQAKQMKIKGFPTDPMQLRQDFGNNVSENAESLIIDAAAFEMIRTALDTANNKGALLQLEITAKDKSKETVQVADIAKLIKEKSIKLDKVQKLKIVLYYAKYIQQPNKWADDTFFYLFAKSQLQLQIAVLMPKKDGQITAVYHLNGRPIDKKQCLFVIYNSDEVHYYSFNRGLQKPGSKELELDKFIDRANEKPLHDYMALIDDFRRAPDKIPGELLSEMGKDLEECRNPIPACCDACSKNFGSKRKTLKRLSMKLKCSKSS